MGFGPIGFGGLASGLDTSAIISSLVALERRPITLLQQQKAGEQKKLDLLGTLEGLVKTLQTKAKELSERSGFFAYALEVGQEGVASFSVTGEAQAAGHELRVFSLAAADRWAFDGVLDPDASLGAGTIEFDLYDEETGGPVHHAVTIQAGSDGLNDVAEAINGAAGDAVTATVVNTGTGASPSWQLVLSGDRTGADHAIQNLTVTGVGLTGQTNVHAASNASIELDGLAIERSSNLFSDVLEGVSFSVTRADPVEGATTSFTIEADVEGVRENLEGFVEAYNAVVDFIAQQQSYSEERGPGGELFGDSALRSVRSTLHGALFGITSQQLAGVQAGTYTPLSSAGLSVDSDGRLELDAAEVDARMAEDLAAFAEVFLGEGADPDAEDAYDGVLLKLDRAIDDLLKDRIATDANGNPIQVVVNGVQKELQIEGLFQRRRTTLQSVMRRIDDQVESLEFRLEKFEESLVLRFARLEELIGGLNAQSAYLSSGAAFPT